MSLSIQDVSAEQLAKLLHHYQRALDPAPVFGKGSESADSWDEIPAQEKRRLVVAAGLALMEMDSSNPHNGESRKYFAKPGEAEWGC